MTATEPLAPAAAEDVRAARDAAHRYLERRQAEARTELEQAQARLTAATGRLAAYRQGKRLTDDEARLVLLDALEDAVRAGRADVADPTEESGAAYTAARDRSRAVLRGLTAAGHPVSTTPERKDHR